jgi:type IV pilus assembly protein PilE
MIIAFWLIFAIIYNVKNSSTLSKGDVYMLTNEKNNAPKGSVSVSQSVSQSVYKLVCRKITALKTSNQAGFTLIELLVVVLIIGILAAIALPQYQVAVLKSKITKLIPLATALYDAEERYRLATGDYTKDLQALDVNIPSNYRSCIIGESYSYCIYDWGRAGVIDGPTNAQVQAENRIAYMKFFKPYPGLTANKGDIFCFAKPDDTAANKVCQIIGGTQVGSASIWNYYKIQ